VLQRTLEIVSFVSPANVAGATMGKQADCVLWHSGNTRETWKQVTRKDPDYHSIHLRESPCTLGRSNDFRDWKETSVQQV